MNENSFFPSATAFVLLVMSQTTHNLLVT